MDVLGVVRCKPHVLVVKGVVDPICEFFKSARVIPATVWKLVNVPHWCSFKIPLGQLNELVVFVIHFKTIQTCAGMMHITESNDWGCKKNCAVTRQVLEVDIGKEANKQTTDPIHRANVPAKRLNVPM